MLHLCSVMKNVAEQFETSQFWSKVKVEGKPFIVGYYILKGLTSCECIYKREAIIIISKMMGFR